MEAQRIGTPETARHGALHTMQQQFCFPGMGLDDLARILWTAPLLGERSIFGPRPGATAEQTHDTRTVHDFSPVFGVRFDVTMRKAREHVLLVGFAQPRRRVPYLSGELVWFLSEGSNGAILDEQINTARARELVPYPVHGRSRSLRRWLFFRSGHIKVMDELVQNIASLA